jgi:ribA/ribD-fused uncharacterized protein
MYPDSSLNLNYETEDTVYWFSSAYDPFNNWSAHVVKIWDRTFYTAEHAYHYRKYSETAPKIAELISVAPSPWAAMQIDKANKKDRRADWSEVRLTIMTEIVRAKVNQNDDVRQCLIKTKNKKIVENSPWDNFWGCGPEGKGDNHMGKLLMLIRGELGN